MNDNSDKQNSGNAVVVGVGARDGLGAALCRRFAGEGLQVFAAGRTAEKLAAVCGEITGLGGRAVPVATNAREDDQVAALLDQVVAAGGIELLVYNAGNNLRCDFLDLESEVFEGMWRTACLGGFVVGREAARRMAPEGQGTILFTGATASIKSRPPFIAFASAKAALRAVAEGMAREFGPQGLHVGHIIIDGGIRGEKLLSQAPQLAEARGEDGLLGLDDIAQSYWMLHRQPRSAWTFELDLRPFKETF